MVYRFMGLIICGLWLGACDEESYAPKPRAYPRVVYPVASQDQTFDKAFCNFTCQLPGYAKVEKDTKFFDEDPKNECWFNVVVPELDAKIYCSYYPVRSRADFDELVSDAFEMVNKHNIKASYINQQLVSRPQDKVYGIVFDIEGAVASTYQFFLTDSTRHFLRGAMYVETQARPDSLAPVIHFMKNDVNKLVSTLKWR